MLSFAAEHAGQNKHIKAAQACIKCCCPFCATLDYAASNTNLAAATIPREMPDIGFGVVLHEHAFIEPGRLMELLPTANRGTSAAAPAQPSSEHHMPPGKHHVYLGQLPTPLLSHAVGPSNSTQVLLSWWLCRVLASSLRNQAPLQDLAQPQHPKVRAPSAKARSVHCMFTTTQVSKHHPGPRARVYATGAQKCAILCHHRL
jgi:hypothetical protein